MRASPPAAAALLLLLLGATMAEASAWRRFGDHVACGQEPVSPSRSNDTSAGAVEPRRAPRTVHSTVGCQRLCRNHDDCRGIQYNATSGRCSLLTQPVQHVHAAPGVTCMGFEDPAVSRSVYVMMPLNLVAADGRALNETELAQLKEDFTKLAAADIDGIMLDVWWGITERSPKNYTFAPYHQIVDLAEGFGWGVQAVASFHRCGGNVGDRCDIPLPSFVREVDGIWYTDAQGNEDREYISLFADNVVVAGGRTPLQMYRDWFAAFREEFASQLASQVISEVQVGMGPCGELRYPAYPMSRWHFCGIGEFVCYDGHAQASLRSAAEAAGNASLALPPGDAGTYNSRPNETAFFREGYKTEAGDFFLDWYFASLKTHGGAVLGEARAVFGDGLRIAGKVAGVHWFYDDPSHAAEATAGYYNVNGRDAYSEIAAVLAAHGAHLDFTCMEMMNTDVPEQCLADPEGLVRQVEMATKRNHVELHGENALLRFDEWAFNEMLSHKSEMIGLSYLRLDPRLYHPANWERFVAFVTAMHGEEDGGGDGDDSARRLASGEGQMPPADELAPSQPKSLYVLV